MKEFKIKDEAPLRKFRAALLVALTAAEKSGSVKLEELQKLDEELSERTAKAEATLDPTDAEAFAKYQQDVQRLQLVRKRIPAEEDKVGEAYQALRGLLRSLRDIWLEAVRDNYVAALDEIARGLAPYYESDGHASQAVRITPLAGVYTNSLGWHGFGDTNYDPIPQAKRALERIDAVLAGESPFPPVHPARPQAPVAKAA